MDAPLSTRSANKFGPYFHVHLKPVRANLQIGLRLQIKEHDSKAVNVLLAQVSARCLKYILTSDVSFHDRLHTFVWSSDEQNTLGRKTTAEPLPQSNLAPNLEQPKSTPFNQKNLVYKAVNVSEHHENICGTPLRRYFASSLHSMLTTIPKSNIATRSPCDPTGITCKHFVETHCCLYLYQQQ